MQEIITAINSGKHSKINNTSFSTKEKFLLLLKRPSSKILPEDMEILATLELLKEDLNWVHNCLDHITDPVLIDSYIYQMQSINMRYQFYLQLCKERGLVANML